MAVVAEEIPDTTTEAEVQAPQGKDLTAVTEIYTELAAEAALENQVLMVLQVEVEMAATEFKAI
jgi:hypothetical protein